MRIGLYAPDSKIPNLPLMKISAYHKQKDDQVEFFKPLFDGQYDLVYISKIFQNTIHYFPLKQPFKYGGSGKSLINKLPYQIEHISPDYELYKIDYAMGFTTRGCNNNCPFCIVRSKEGILHPHAPITEFWQHQEKIQLLDNSITDSAWGILQLKLIHEYNLKLDLNQGFNVRTISLKKAQLLSKIKLWNSNKTWKIAWDNIHEENQIMKGINLLFQAGVSPKNLMCYVLVGFNSSLKQDLYRISKLIQLQIEPFIMRFRKTPILNILAKWVNRKPIFHSVSFENFIKNKPIQEEIKN